MSAEQDTEIVRANFRHVVRCGFWVAAGLSLLHASVFFLAEHAVWRWNVGVALLWIVLTRFMVLSRGFPVFLAALLGCVAAMVAYSSFLTLSFGRAAAFHTMLMCLLPLVAVSGRIGPGAKWVIALTFGAYIVALDVLSARGDHPLPDVVAGVLRATNLMLLVLVLTGLTHHYFALVARQQAQLQVLAATDALTGLMNRRQLMSSGDLFVKQCRRQALPLSVILCDLDHFKAVNDRLGHDAGDAVLKHAAGVFLRGVRETDAAGRWGGEEFLLLLPGADSQGALGLADRIRMNLAASPVVIGRDTVRVTVTMGVATLAPEEP